MEGPEEVERTFSYSQDKSQNMWSLRVGLDRGLVEEGYNQTVYLSPKVDPKNILYVESEGQCQSSDDGGPVNEEVCDGRKIRRNEKGHRRYGIRNRQLDKRVVNKNTYCVKVPRD